MKAKYSNGYTSSKTAKMESSSWAVYEILQPTAVDTEGNNIYTDEEKAVFDEEMAIYLTYHQNRLAKERQATTASGKLWVDRSRYDAEGLPMYTQTEIQLKNDYGALCEAGEIIDITFSQKGNPIVYVQNKSEMYKLKENAKALGVSNKELFELLLNGTGALDKVKAEMNKPKPVINLQKAPISPKEEPKEEKKATKSRKSAAKAKEGLDGSF